MTEVQTATDLLEQNADECSVCVAVHVRPLIDSELLDGCDSLLTTTPDQPQVQTRPTAAGSSFKNAAGLRELANRRC